MSLEWIQPNLEASMNLAKRNRLRESISNISNLSRLGCGGGSCATLHNCSRVLQESHIGILSKAKPYPLLIFVQQLGSRLKSSNYVGKAAIPPTPCYVITSRTYLHRPNGDIKETVRVKFYKGSHGFDLNQVIASFLRLARCTIIIHLRYVLSFFWISELDLGGCFMHYRCLIYCAWDLMFPDACLPTSLQNYWSLFYICFGCASVYFPAVIMA